MSSAGQIVGGIAGGVAGFFLGFGPAGAAIGFGIGAGIGGYIDPPKMPNINSPSLDDKSFQSSAYGVSIPRLYGTIATMGNVIYLENNEYRAVTKKESQGGKGGGGGANVETTTYLATFAVSFCEATPNARLRRIWAGGKLYYDAGQPNLAAILASNTSGFGGSPRFKFYNGTQTDPDSRMEASLGVGNCPSYEGTVYIIFYDFDLTDYGNGLAGCPIKVEIISDHEIEETDPEKIFSASYPYSPAFVYDESTDEEIYKLPLIRHIGKIGAGVLLRANPGYTPNAIANKFIIRDGVVRYTEVEPFLTSDFSCPGLNDGTGIPATINDIDENANDGDYYAKYVTGHQSRFGKSLLFGDGGLWCGSPVFIFPGDELAYNVAVAEDSYFVLTNYRLIHFDLDFSIISDISMPPLAAINQSKLWVYKDSLYICRNHDQWYFTVYDFDLNLTHSFALEETAPVVEGYFVVIDGLVWRCWSTHPSYADEPAAIHIDCWTTGFSDTLTSVRAVPLNSVCEDIFKSAGVDSAFFDIENMDGKLVDGYRYETGSSRSKIQPLQAGYLFDLAEYGYKIKSIFRDDQSSQGVIAFMDLMMDGQNAISSSQYSASDLPSLYTIQYIDYQREYDKNSQSAPFPSTFSNERIEQLPIVFSADRAAELADIFVNLSWAESQSLKIKLTQKYLHLKLGQVWTLEVSPGTYRNIRIEQKEVSPEQTVSISAKSVDFAAFDTSAVGAGGETPPGQIGYQLNSYALVADLPLVYEAYNSYGMAAAIYADDQLSGFRGSVLQGSRNNGQTYANVATFTSLGTIGQVGSAHNTDDCFIIDRITQLNMNVICGTFESITEAQMMQGANYCAYGANGRWEIIRFATATLQTNGSVVLSTMLRGLHGTEWAANLHSPGDFMFLLSDIDNQFVSVDPTIIGIESVYRSLSIGRTGDPPEPESAIYRGVNLRPLSPVDLRYSMLSDDYVFTFSRRSRFASSLWVTGNEVPIGEGIESYSIDIIIDGSVVRTINSSTTEFTYTSAQQIEDAGELVNIFDVSVCQISSLVGRGYNLDSTVTRLGGDPLLSLVVSLNHFDGENDSTVIDDDAGLSWSVVGSAAKLSTAQKKWGSASLAVNGKTSNINTAAGLMLPTDDLTIECWIRIDSTQTGGTSIDSWRGCIIGQPGTGGGSGQLFGVYKDGANNKLRFFRGSALGSINIMGGTTITQDQWHFVQLIYDATADLFSLFLDGASQGTASSSTGWNNTANVVMIGKHTVSGLESYDIGWDGWIDDLRITKSSARSTTVPTGPFFDF